MKERPILFNGEMVRAVLAGRKTQTRRVCKQQPHPWARHYFERGCSPLDWAPAICDDDTWDLFSGAAESQEPHFGRCPYGKPGERLWVREAFQLPATKDELSPSECEGCSVVFVAAGTSAQGWGRQRPSIHMPRWASRVLLRVTDVRVQRIQDITASNVRAEGIGDASIAHWEQWLHHDDAPGHAFSILWDKINAKRGHSWEKNPWVWAVTFEVMWP